MTEPMDNMELTPESPAKSLRILLYLTIANIAVSIVSLLPIDDGFTLWISKAISAGMIFCLFRLQTFNIRYKKSAIFHTVELCCTLFVLLTAESSLITLASSIFSIMAVYQEYSAHSEMVAQLDPKLSRNWHSLFNWQIIIGILFTVVSVVVTLVMIAAYVPAESVVLLITVLISAVGTILQIIYLNYLHKMIRLLET